MPLLDLLYLFLGLLELSPKTLLDIRQVAQLGFGPVDNLPLRLQRRRLLRDVIGQCP